MAKEKDTAVAEASVPSFAEQLSDVRKKSATAQEEKRLLAEDAIGRYRVECGEFVGEYDARDANEAWAKFCDAHKTWPSPKYTKRTINKIG